MRALAFALAIAVASANAPRALAETPAPLVATTADGAAAAWTPAADKETLRWCGGGLAAGLVLGGPLGCLGATGTALVLEPKSPAEKPPEYRAAYAREMKKRRVAGALAGGSAAIVIITIGYGIAYAIHPPASSSEAPPGLRGAIRP